MKNYNLYSTDNKACENRILSYEADHVINFSLQKSSKLYTKFVLSDNVSKLLSKI